MRAKDSAHPNPTEVKKGEVCQRAGACALEVALGMGSEGIQGLSSVSYAECPGPVCMGRGTRSFSSGYQQGWSVDHHLSHPCSDLPYSSGTSPVAMGASVLTVGDLPS